VREAAVAALGAIGDERGLDAILHATTDKPAVRRRAVLALAPFVDPAHPRAAAVDAALARALADRDWQVRQAAEDITSVA
jgi:HEAT repeat protein